TDGAARRAMDDGAPIDFIYPEDGVIVFITPMAVMDNAPHPNAARVLMNYILSREIQEEFVMTMGGYYVPNSAVTYPDSYPDPASLNLVKVDTNELAGVVEEYRARWLSIMSG